MTNSTRTLVLWCPDWPLVAAGIPAEVPAAVFSANRVVACTARARADGVRRSLRRREAQRRCPELIIKAYDPVGEARAFEPVVAAVEAFTPKVEVIRPGACALATRGPSRYFGGDAALAGVLVTTADRVLAAITEGAPPTQAGVADGPFAAALAARHATVVPPGQSGEFLAPFPVSTLDLPDLASLLRRLGLQTLGDFAALPEAEVVARFGPEGALAHRRASGFDDRPLQARTPPLDLSATIELDPPAESIDPAAFAAKAMADELCQTLTAAGLICTCIRIESQTEHGEQLSRVWRHHRAFTSSAIADRVRWQLEGWLAQRATCGCSVPPPGLGQPCPGGAACPSPAGGTSGGLTMVRLTPEEVVPDDGRQGGFWGGTTAADERAGRGLARLQGLLGPEAVCTAVLGGGRGPGEQVRLVTWGDRREPTRPGSAAPTVEEPSRSSPRRARPKRSMPAGSRWRSSGRSPSPNELPVWPGRLPSPSPALVHREPANAELVDADDQPVGVSGRGVLTSVPARLSVAGGTWAGVEAWAGPWPVDERWWDPSVHQRRARLQIVVTGKAYLLALETGKWWVEASYD